MMGLYDATINPAQTFEVVQAVRDLLAGSANVVTTGGIENADNVFAFYSEGNPLPDRYLIVRERAQVGSRIQSISGRDVVPIQVEAVISRHNPNPHQWLSAIHDRVYSTLVNQKPTLTRGAMELPISRELVPSPPELDEDVDEWFSTALYYAPVKAI